MSLLSFVHGLWSKKKTAPASTVEHDHQVVVHEQPAHRVENQRVSTRFFVNKDGVCVDMRDTKRNIIKNITRLFGIVPRYSGKTRRFYH